MGTYRPGGEKLILLLIRYTNAQKAASAYREFGRVYLKDKPPADSRRRVEAIEKGRQVGVLVKGRFLVLIFEAVSRAACERLLNEAARRL